MLKPFLFFKKKIIISKNSSEISELDQSLSDYKIRNSHLLKLSRIKNDQFNFHSYYFLAIELPLNVMTYRINGNP